MIAAILLAASALASPPGFWGGPGVPVHMECISTGVANMEFAVRDWQPCDEIDGRDLLHYSRCKPWRGVYRQSDFCVARIEDYLPHG